ncbi:hypothetical protein GQ600_15900 [Phytophthora cactorum]|nr:hypothetical protein GQ600_15900 [Phytophthora cactorum]
MCCCHSLDADGRRCGSVKGATIDKPDAIGIRLGVKTRTNANGRVWWFIPIKLTGGLFLARATVGGCNGLSYTMNYADKKEKMEEK